MSKTLKKEYESNEGMNECEWEEQKRTHCAKRQQRKREEKTNNERKKWKH